MNERLHSNLIEWNIEYFFSQLCFCWIVYIFDKGLWSSHDMIRDQLDQMLKDCEILLGTVSITLMVNGETHFRTLHFDIHSYLLRTHSHRRGSHGISFVNDGLLNWYLQNLSLSIQEKRQSIWTIIIVKVEPNEIRNCSGLMIKMLCY